MIALLTACLFFEILVHVLNIASAKARTKTVFGHLKLLTYESFMTATLICLLAYPINRTRAVVNVVAGGCNAVKKVRNSRKRITDECYREGSGV